MYSLAQEVHRFAWGPDPRWEGGHTWACPDLPAADILNSIH